MRWRCWRKSQGRSSMCSATAFIRANGEPMEVVVGELLRQRKETISVAESCHRRSCWQSASRQSPEAPIIRAGPGSPIRDV